MTAKRGDRANAPLGELGVDAFLRRHWQKRPVLLRGAMPPDAFPMAPAQVVALAARDDVESRLVRQRSGRWSLRHGPFAEGDVPGLRARAWTLLVQGVDLHDDRVAALRDRFRFVPDVRLDDVMVSVAGDGGGVGPHVDSYDVFLLQAHGRRRWRIGRCRDATLVADAPLKLLQRFESEHAWTLEPGDMLYLPPGWAHDGVADGPCMTASIGFRAPSRHEFLRAWLAELADAPGGPDPRYRDPSLVASRAAARIPDALSQTLRAWAHSVRPDREALDAYVGRFLTEPKPDVWFEPPRAIAAQATFCERASRHGVRADRRTRFAWRARRLFVNGELAEVAADRLLRTLADARALSPREASEACADGARARALWHWWCAGWIHVGRAPRDALLESPT